MSDDHKIWDTVGTGDIVSIGDVDNLEVWGFEKIRGAWVVTVKNEVGAFDKFPVGKITKVLRK